MAARGSVLKKEVSKKILEAFSGNSFLYNDGKEIRINGTEDGQPLQIKITLTCAKVAVENEENNFSFGEKDILNKNNTNDEKKPQEPTLEEKERLKTLLTNLGF